MPPDVAAAAEFHVAISRRNGAFRADEIILRLNWPHGTTFTFLSLKALTGANYPSSNSHCPRRPKGHVLAKYGLQFFTISMFKGRCNQLKVLTGRKFQGSAHAATVRSSGALDRFATGKIGGMAVFPR